MSKKPLLQDDDQGLEANQPLTDQQKVFVTEYLKDMNAKRAYAAAGYLGKTDFRRLLSKPHIVAALNHELRKDGLLGKPTVERILTEYMRIAFFDPKELFYDDGTPKPLNQISEDARRCIAGIEVALEGSRENATTIQRYKIIDKHKALENLGRHLSMFTDKLKIDLPTELGNMTDEQIDATIRQLTEVTSSISAASGKAKTIN